MTNKRPGLFRRILNAFSKEKPRNFANFPSYDSGNPNFTYERLYTEYKNPDDVHLDIALQARSLVTSVGIVSGALLTLKSEILGEKGLLIDVNTEDYELNEKVEFEFNKWARNTGAYKTLYKLQHEILHNYYVDGEVFIYIRFDDDRLNLQLLDTFRLSSLTDEKKKIAYGIKYDDLGAPVAYYFEKEANRTRLPVEEKDTIKIDAEYIIHFKHGGGMRGMSPLAPVIDMSFDANQLIKAEIRRGIITSEYVGFMKTPEGLDGDCGMFKNIAKDAFGRPAESLEGEVKPKEIYNVTPGILSILPPGFEPQFASPQEPPDLKKFLDSYYYSLSGALGLTYPTLTGDLSQVNYSSIRAGSLKERRQYGVIQNLLTEVVLNRIFECWIMHPANYGKPAFQKVRDYILDNYAFKNPTWKHVDPVKEANSMKVMLESGITTLTETLKAKGKDVIEHLQELDQDIPLYEKLAEKLTLIDGIKDNEIAPNTEADDEQ